MKPDFARLFTLLLASSSLAACSSLGETHDSGENCKNVPAEGTETIDLTGKSFACEADAGADAGGAVGIDTNACTCEAVCNELRKQPANSCRFLSSTSVECTFPQTCPGGRKPELLVAPRLPLTDRRTTFLLGCAHMEAASVVAFERLAVEMSALGAPDSLLERLHGAAADEVRHGRDVLALAGNHPMPHVDAPSPGQRSAFAVALENAREGCVRETFAALIARRQAATARDVTVRSVMTTIAADETRHAELSWELASWLEGQLDPSERAALSAARVSEAAVLRAEIASGGLLEDADLGLPGAREAVALLDGLFGAQGIH